MIELLLWVAACACSLLLTGRVRAYAIAQRILDHPNPRSSHTRPTPRGGGIAIVVTCLAGTVLLAVAGAVPWRVAAALLGGGAAVSAIGWLDDSRNGVSPLVKALVHLLSAIWGLSWLGAIDSLRLEWVWLPLGFTGPLLAALGIVWSINLFNFMDGIDGIAAGQAATVGLFAALLIRITGNGPTSPLALLIAGSACGFLFWNWAPARIFMGDVASGFLGYVFAILALSSEQSGDLPLTAWLVLSGVFLFDSTATLLRRMARGEKWYAAHRSHAYQRLVGVVHSHGVATSIVLALNVVLAGITLLGIVLDRMPYAAIGGLLLLAAAYSVVERANPMKREVAPARSLDRTTHR